MFKSIIYLLCVFLYACSQEQNYVKKNCIGHIEDFDEKILMKQVKMPLSYIIHGDSIKVNFADREIKAALMKTDDQKNSLIHNLDDNYFVHLLNQSGLIEYEFNPDRWYIGSCK